MYIIKQSFVHTHARTYTYIYIFICTRREFGKYGNFAKTKTKTSWNEEDKLIISMFTGYLYSEILILLFRNIFI